MVKKVILLGTLLMLSLVASSSTQTALYVCILKPFLSLDVTPVSVIVIFSIGLSADYIVKYKQSSIHKYIHAITRAPLMNSRNQLIISTINIQKN